MTDKTISISNKVWHQEINLSPPQIPQFCSSDDYWHDEDNSQCVALRFNRKCGAKPRYIHTWTEKEHYQWSNKQSECANAYRAHHTRTPEFM